MQDNKVALTDSLKAIVNVIEDMRRAMREMETKVKNLYYGTDRLETELERQLSVQERTNREVQKLKNELALLKEEMQTIGHTTSVVKLHSSAPVQESKEAVSSKPALHSAQPIHTGTTTVPSPERIVKKSDDSLPAMQGSGFSHITYDYLKKLNKK